MVIANICLAPLRIGRVKTTPQRTVGSRASDKFGTEEVHAADQRGETDKGVTVGSEKEVKIGRAASLNVGKC